MLRKSSELKPDHRKFWEKTDKSRPSFFREPEKPSQPIAESAANAAENARFAALLTLPVITVGGVKTMIEEPFLAPIMVPYTIGGIILDTLKAPFSFVIATEEAARAGVTKLASLLFEKSPIEEQINRIYKSFLQRMRETAAILVVLDLEDKDTLDRKLKSGDIEELVALTLLHTAYASRNSSGLVLANNKSLSREDCPVEGLALFDKIADLKESIKLALTASNKKRWYKEDERNLEDSRLVCEWIKLVKKGRTITATDKPEANQSEIDLVNKIILQINDLKEHAMSQLPESPRNVARHMPSLKSL